MKSQSKDHSNLIVVNPAARRCGADEQPEEKHSDVDFLVEQAKGANEFLAISDRILGFATQVDQDMAKLHEAVENTDAAGLEKSAQRIANAASEVGASNLIRACYQLLITVRQGDQAAAFKISEQVKDEYKKLKTALRLA